MGFKKNIKKYGLTVAYRSRLFRFLGNFSPKNFLTVLNYHRVDYADQHPELDPSLISATPDVFEAQMRLLRDDFSPVSIADVLDSLAGKRTLPRRAVLVTVDDGYRDYGDYIFPIATKYGVSPLLFLTTAYVDAGTFWWDKLYQAVNYAEEDMLECAYGNYDIATPAQRKATLRSLRSKIKATTSFSAAMQNLDELYQKIPLEKQDELLHSATLNWDELRTLTKQGADIAAHTHTHPLLTRIPFEDACKEISHSRSLITQKLEQSLPVFAFTDGQPQFFSENLITFLEKENIKVGFTTIDRSAILSAKNALAFPRVGVYQRLSLEAFAYRLTPLYKAFA
mgnify:CR=1 FL=1